MYGERPSRVAIEVIGRRCPRGGLPPRARAVLLAAAAGLVIATVLLSQWHSELVTRGDSLQGKIADTLREKFDNMEELSDRLRELGAASGRENYYRAVYDLLAEELRDGGWGVFVPLMDNFENAFPTHTPSAMPWTAPEGGSEP